MKTLWNLLCVLALANLLAIIGFVGWLGATDRLSLDRLRAIRVALSATNADEVAKQEEETKKVKEEEKVAAEKKRMEGAPESAAERNDRVRAADDAREQSRNRSMREIEDLRRSLLKDRADLDADKAALAAERKKFEAARAEIEKQTSDEQFKQALSTLEAQKAKDAHSVLKAMIDDQKRDQAIAYLAGMGERQRSRILAEFVKVDEKLAATLLEQLRTRGVTAPPKPPAEQP